MRNLAAGLIGNRNGATFVGYGLIAGLMALTAVAVATSIGGALGGFTETGSGTTVIDPVA